jgi:hypothetical protein
VLLFEQFAPLRSPAVLILAAGYLFDAFLIIPHTLTFPGAFPLFYGGVDTLREESA